MYICNWLCFCVVPIREVRQKKAFGKTDCVITLRLLSQAHLSRLYDFPNEAFQYEVSLQ